MKSKSQNYINHIVFVVDRSGSMSGKESAVVKVFDNQIKYLAKRSKELDQETRVTVYQFNTSSDCVIYDKDALRLPSIQGHYSTGGGTGLIDATLKAIKELGETPQRYGDHSFLIYVLTDGQETQRTGIEGAEALQREINKLPDNWTLGVFVPDAQGVHEAKRFGFPANNISVWSTNSQDGVSEVGNTMQAATESYMTSRATGVRGTKNLFQLNTQISTSAVKNNLEELKASEYEVLLVRSYDDGKAIKEFVESWTKNPYRVGSAYYQLTKPEKVQASKEICIQEKRSGKVFTGANARSMLGLPPQEVKVSPADFGTFNIFVQSTSVNRKLVKDTQLIVLK